jgi:hypothetical protein
MGLTARFSGAATRYYVGDVMEIPAVGAPCGHLLKRQRPKLPTTEVTGSFDHLVGAGKQGLQARSGRVPQLPEASVSFDHLAGEREKRRRNREAELLRGLEIDDEF